MNCRKFAEVVGGIARAELMEASAQNEALQHASDCPACQVRLADERLLSEALSSLASVDRERPVPPIDEWRLRGAFRESRLENISSRGSWSGGLRYLGLVGLAIAAATVVFFGGSILWRSAVTQSPRAPEPIAQQSRGSGLSTELVAPETRPSTEVVGTSTRDPVRGGQMRTRLSVRHDSSYVDVSLGDFQPAKEEDGEFLPTLQGGDGGPMTSGQLVRVVMPRSAMTYFGLPMNVDRVHEGVKADVLVGEDGLARAIRFVR